MKSAAKSLLSKATSHQTQNMVHEGAKSLATNWQKNLVRSAATGALIGSASGLATGNDVWESAGKGAVWGVGLASGAQVIKGAQKGYLKAGTVASTSSPIAAKVKARKNINKTRNYSMNRTTSKQVKSLLTASQMANFSKQVNGLA